MKIGIIRETKHPIDNRVALTPSQIKLLSDQFPEYEFFVQSSEIRAYSDDEYARLNIPIVNNVDNCDILFGIKEVDINALIPNKHYFFFGHIAKMQSYNRSLLQEMIKKNITFTDYEYLVDDRGKRVCAFGWWAGAVGVYYTLRGYGLKYNLYELPKPDLRFTLQDLLNNLKKIDMPSIKIVLTGTGRVSEGAQYVLNNIGVNKVDEDLYLSSQDLGKISYTIADTSSLVKRIDGAPFNREDFAQQPTMYKSDFMKFARVSDIFISAHFWGGSDPIYLSKEELKDDSLSIKMIGDITCDIMGSIKSTLRSSTHEMPYYDYNPYSECEEPAFSSKDNITVMAVDTCPNALAIDASQYFGDMIIQHVLFPLLKNDGVDENLIIDNGTILNRGELTNKFNYLSDFAYGK